MNAPCSCRERASTCAPKPVPLLASCRCSGVAGSLVSSISEQNGFGEHVKNSLATTSLSERVEQLYEQAKSGRWEHVWRALVGEDQLAAACSRYSRPASGWTFLHQAAYAGDEAAVRVLLRLGASLSARSKHGETARTVARERGHAALDVLMREAEASAEDLWQPSSDANLLPSSRSWATHTERRAWRELHVGYAGGRVVIPAGARYYVDSFERVLVGWHGTYDPPAGMDGESML